MFVQQETLRRITVAHHTQTWNKYKEVREMSRTRLHYYNRLSSRIAFFSHFFNYKTRKHKFPCAPRSDRGQEHSQER